MVDEKELIENFLKENKQGLSIQELSDKTNFPRQKVVIILAELKGEQKINIREIGQVKLHYWNEGDKR
jgi:predicted transcriptional regulator